MGNVTAEEAAHANLSYGELVIGALFRLGVEHFVVSPGSRSTPLVMALGKLDAEHVTVVLDERSAAFRALGRIKATGRPVVLVCTSGTAGAHYFPAVIEAREAGLPLVVLTADRPPELRHCHAGQTIDQLKLYGTYPVYHAELPLPVVDSAVLRQVRETCRVAVEAAMGLPAGPVHLNCPFREPFFSKTDEPVPLDKSLLEGLRPVQRCRVSVTAIPDLPARTLILAGPVTGMEPAEYVDSALALSRQRGFPILADGSNPLRYAAGASAQTVIHYDRIARNESQWKNLQPDAVLLLGEPPTSKHLRARLAELDVKGYLLTASKRAMNPFYGRVEWVGDSIQPLLQEAPVRQSEFLDEWIGQDQKMEAGLIGAMDLPHALFEGDLHRLLGEILPDRAAVCYASSLAIRDAEWYMPKREDGLRPYSQRGANGIDGTLSLARGIAGGLSEPAWLVTGDLAFLHDANGLANLGQDRSGIFVVLINNQGGGIFEMLPVAQRTGSFESLYATPQTVDFAKLVEAHGGTHQVMQGLPGLRESVANWKGRGLFVAEVQVDRKVSKELHRSTLVLED